jgi:anti-sigma factor RsiW
MHPTDLLLNDYVDEGLAAAERESVDRHLQDCDRCRAIVADLGELRRAAANLPPMEPPARTWTAIERALRSTSADSQTSAPFREPSPRHASHRDAGEGRSSRVGRPVRLWGGLAAAAALVVATLVGFRVVTDRETEQVTEAPTAQSVEAELRQAEEHYQKAISGLEQIAAADKGALDPGTAATLQKNLAVVDQAIGESRAALRAQPNSEPAQASLLDSFKAKLALLENTVALINEMRKGNEAGAAQIVSSLKRGS